MELTPEKYALATLHRPANVDKIASLRAILKILAQASSTAKILWPVHPRTAKNFELFGLTDELSALSGVTQIEPLGYFEFISLLSGAAFVLTDSGGIQAEATWLRVPCITLRETTEQPITLEEGTNRLTGLDFPKITAALEWAENFDREKYVPPTLWDGRAAERTISVILEKMH